MQHDDPRPKAADHETAAERPGPTLGALAAIAREALDIRPRRYAASILGLPRTWIPPYRRYSELKTLDLWYLRRTLKTLVNVLVPAIPRTPPAFGPPLIGKVFWQPTVILQRPDHHGSYTSFPDEAWFFINGIMTNDVIAQANAAYLAHLFHRPITLVQNATDSLPLDLLECALGKHWQRNTESAIKAFPAIYDALKSPHKRRVVVIAHSQGTIIMASVLRWLCAITRTRGEAGFESSAYAPPVFVYPNQEPLELAHFEPLTPDELGKLEIYCFATCASTMRYFRPPVPGTGAHGSGAGPMPWPIPWPIPWIEHFGNEYDIVARLGMQAPNARRWGIEIDGPRYVRAGAWGHLLVEHYLFDIEARQRQGRRRGARGGPAPFQPADTGAGAQTPRLYHYINGGCPDVDASRRMPSPDSSAARR